MSMAKLRFFSPWMRQELAEHVPYADLGINLERMRRWHPLHRGLYFGIRAHLPGLLLAAKGDRVAMHSSVETRYPFLDEDVFTYLARLHPRWKLRGLRDKICCAGWPNAGCRCPSRASQGDVPAPLDSFHDRDAPPFVEQLLSEKACARPAISTPKPSLTGDAPTKACGPAPCRAFPSRWDWWASSRRNFGIRPSSAAAWRMCRLSPTPRMCRGQTVMAGKRAVGQTHVRPAHARLGVGSQAPSALCRLDAPSPERPLMSTFDLLSASPFTEHRDYLLPPPRSVALDQRGRWTRAGFLAALLLVPNCLLWFGYERGENLRHAGRPGKHYRRPYRPRG